MNTLEHPTVGEYVAEDFRTAAIFSKYGIDFCCKGNRTIEEACEKKDIDPEEVKNEVLQVLNTQTGQEIDFKSWPTDLLIDYIEKTHHRYVEEKSTALLFYLDKLCKVHGQKHPELFEITSHFSKSAGELAQHMKKEELILFPFIKKMDAAIRENKSIPQPQFGTVDNPISMMMHEHDNEGERFRIIAKLTHEYNPPADACETYKVTYAMLRDFELDLHKHIHLENNIVFPRAKAMEAKLTA
ncbi:iron-sulfur cluster repair di-iron protein [Flavobacterium sp.]|uniref:iron-sulfur cluster repair di-iron protein n=1 Tax=Flavobacterium sp. TaxID=239 RepID=UPI0026096D29|nr:iron-sulfur cluster repair di-iron protein [Flavobacterium sp.]MDD3005278.1 iron-sulfur cluster repair di-iron protein [Flavobacterium sp.]